MPHGNLGNHRPVGGAEKVGLCEDVSVGIHGDRQALVGLAHEGHAVLDGAEHGHVAVDRINFRPVMAGDQHQTGTFLSSLLDDSREVQVIADHGRKHAKRCGHGLQLSVALYEIGLHDVAAVLDVLGHDRSGRVD